MALVQKIELINIYRNNMKILLNLKNLDKKVGLNWLPPLLTPILRDPATLTVPIVYPIGLYPNCSQCLFNRSVP